MTRWRRGAFLRAHSPMRSSPKPMYDGSILPTTLCPGLSLGLRQGIPGPVVREVTDQAVGP